MLTLRPATDADLTGIRSLLEGNGLPTSDLNLAQPEFVVACDDGAIVGAGGLQRFGATALLRSVAVEAGRRRAGLGRSLVQSLEERARASGVGELVLLTQTAEGFFDGLGYRTIERQRAPVALQGCEEFRSLCPASAVCMSKTLTTPTPATAP